MAATAAIAIPANPPGLRPEPLLRAVAVGINAEVKAPGIATMLGAGRVYENFACQSDKFPRSSSTTGYDSWSNMRPRMKKPVGERRIGKYRVVELYIGHDAI